VLFDPECVAAPANGACAATQGVLLDTLCYETHAPLDAFADAHDFTRKRTAHEARVAFAASAGDVICVAAAPTADGACGADCAHRETLSPYDRPQIRLLNATGGLVAYAEHTAPEGDDGIAMYGQTVPAAGDYTAVVAGYKPSAKLLVTASACADARREYADVASETLAECRTRASASRWDKCASPDGTPLTFSDDFKTVTVGGLVGEEHRVFGNAGLEFLTSGASYGKFYWEIKTAAADASATDTAAEFYFGVSSVDAEEYAMRSAKDGKLYMKNFGCYGGGTCNQLDSRGHAKLGDTLMFALDVPTNTPPTPPAVPGMWIGRNGFWDGPLNVATGTVFNNFDPNDELGNAPAARNFSLCADTRFFDCRKPPDTWDYADPSTYGVSYYHCCPFRDALTFFGIATEFWPDAYFVPAISAYDAGRDSGVHSGTYTEGQNWVSQALGNPVRDAQGSLSANSYYETLSKQEMITVNEYVFPRRRGVEGSEVHDQPRRNRGWRLRVPRAVRVQTAGGPRDGRRGVHCAGPRRHQLLDRRRALRGVQDPFHTTDVRYVRERRYPERDPRQSVRRARGLGLLLRRRGVWRPAAARRRRTSRAASTATSTISRRGEARVFLILHMHITFSLARAQ
jgi:hypothetical protein